jgi:hypothetical protein
MDFFAGFVRSREDAFSKANTGDEIIETGREI